jgi:hypothetical protein
MRLSVTPDAPFAREKHGGAYSYEEHRNGIRAGCLAKALQEITAPRPGVREDLVKHSARCQARSEFVERRREAPTVVFCRALVFV